MSSRVRSNRPMSFRAYVDIEFQERPVDVPEENEEAKFEPNLLPGEIVIAEANNVLKFAPLKTNKTGISGTLFVTNFKVSFVTSLPVDGKEAELHELSLQSHFLSVNDICLSEIDLVYQITEGSTKKKRLLHNAPLPSRLPGLQLVLKNLRVINFSFKFTPVGEDLRICKALLHHAFPPTVDHLFLSYGYPPSQPGIPDFCVAQDWERELQRTRCPNWRVSKHNEFFNLCSSLPTVVVVPRDLLDAQLEQAAQHFQGTRPPVWCWGSLAGAALVRMAQISPNINDRQQENRMMGLVHRCHPKKLQPTILDLDQILPSLKEIQMSYIKLRELHTPDDPLQFWEQDRHYWSRWESSRWMLHLSKCLEVAQNAASAIIHHNSSVILQDLEGRDLSAVISCLVQLFLDPQVRTLRGFHSLVQKEWVALGHPFSTRLGHTRNNPEEQSPVWLLFLDCVHQVTLQHPGALEFTSEYLLALWHAAHCSLHSTFMFNSVSAKSSAIAVLQRENPQQPVYLRSIWSWWSGNDSLFDNQQNGSTENGINKRNQETREAFLNVHYIQKLFENLTIKGSLGRVVDSMSSAHDTWHRIQCLLETSKSLPFSPSTPPVPVQLDGSLRIDVSVSNLKPWQECFGRWLSEPVVFVNNDPNTLLKQTDPTKDHWKQIYQMYNHMKSNLPEIIPNGTVK
ncbi:myotubularin-related protein 10-B [Palaemon carinicauda]|uniref:myotubularin-related protein 10-B n=1 Tax=Palaemon carinicauda TaxID=392227 RepID=UPI0035B5B427